MNYKTLFSCENKIAIVTGGAGLIGREIALGLHAFGARVYIADINEADAGKLIRDNIRFRSFDMTSEESILNSFSEIVKEEGRIDIVVNSAYPRTADWGAKFEYIKLDSWKNNIDSNLGGLFISCRAAAEQMKKQGGGSLINLASIYGVTAPDFSIYEGTEMTMPAAYSAIKGGVISLTKYIASYYGVHNVRANSISPGGILDGQAASFVEKYSEKTPLGRMGKAEEIVGAAVYLASDASSYVTGENIIVDGGWTAW